MCTNFGDPRSRDRKLRQKKNVNFFSLKSYEVAYNSKTT